MSSMLASSAGAGIALSWFMLSAVGCHSLPDSSCLQSRPLTCGPDMRVDRQQLLAATPGVHKVVKEACARWATMVRHICQVQEMNTRQFHRIGWDQCQSSAASGSGRRAGVVLCHSSKMCSKVVEVVHRAGGEGAGNAKLQHRLGTWCQSLMPVWHGAASGLLLHCPTCWYRMALIWWR